MYISFGLAWKVLLLIHNCQHCTAHFLKNILENYQVVLFFFLWWDFWSKFVLLTIFMLADVYLVMCHDNFKLLPMPRTLHSLPVGAHFLERVFVTHIKYYCINTEPRCTRHGTVLTIYYDLLPKYLLLIMAIGCSHLSPEVNTGRLFGGISKVYLCC